MDETLKGLTRTFTEDLYSPSHPILIRGDFLYEENQVIANSKFQAREPVWPFTYSNPDLLGIRRIPDYVQSALGGPDFVDRPD